MADYFDEAAQAADEAALRADRLNWVKPSLQFSILCFEVRQDEEGSLDFLRVFMGFNVEISGNVTGVDVGFTVVNGWTNGVGVYRGGVRILAPDGSLVYEEERPVVLRNRTIRHAVEHGPEFSTMLSGYYKIQPTLEGEAVMEYLTKITFTRA